MDLSDDLVKLFESGDGHMFVPPKKQAPVTADDRLATSFQQITDFVKKYDRLPEIESNDIGEASLAARLNSIRTDKTKAAALALIDELGLLEAPEAPESVDELFSEDTFGLFDGSGSDILKIKNVTNPPKKATPESVSRRKPASDFAKFKPGFMKLQQALKTGEYKLVRFTNSNQIAEERYYISMGQMVYIESIGDKKIVRGAPKARTRLIFENGTESNMYERSLAIDLYEDGYLVVGKDYSGEVKLEKSDKIAGYIYVLKSKSSDEKIMNIKDLHKIGFSTTTVTERIKHAESDPTYLMSGVNVVDSYILTGDYNPQKVEHFIHRIFADAKVDLTIIGPDGREHVPSEWYSVPLIAIEQAVNMLQNGDIIDYHYDKGMQRIVPNREVN